MRAGANVSGTSDDELEAMGQLNSASHKAARHSPHTDTAGLFGPMLRHYDPIRSVQMAYSLTKRYKRYNWQHAAVIVVFSLE